MASDHCERNIRTITDGQVEAKICHVRTMCAFDIVEVEGAQTRSQRSDLFSAYANYFAEAARSTRPSLPYALRAVRAPGLSGSTVAGGLARLL